MSYVDHYTNVILKNHYAKYHCEELKDWKSTLKKSITLWNLQYLVAYWSL
jgi:hypothetical protein